MTTSLAQNSNETVQGGQQPQQHPQHHDYPPIAANDRRNMDPRQSGNYLASAINQTVPQLGINSSSNTEKQPDNNPMGSNPQPASSELNHANGDKSLMLPPNGDTINAQDAQKQSNSTAAPATPSDLPRRSGPRSEVTAGYERKIGRGTSWRRDHEARTEGDYTVRGRGRGAPPGRGGGRGQYHRDTMRGIFLTAETMIVDLHLRLLLPTASRSFASPTIILILLWIHVVYHFIHLPDPYYDSRGSIPISSL